MSARVACPTCHRDVQVRLDGALKLHRHTDGSGCPGGGINHDAEAAEAKRLTQAERDCELLGIGHLWDKLAAAVTPSERIARDVLATLARFFVEDGRS